MYHIVTDNPAPAALEKERVGKSDHQPGRVISQVYHSNRTKNGDRYMGTHYRVVVSLSSHAMPCHATPEGTGPVKDGNFAGGFGLLLYNTDHACNTNSHPSRGITRNSDSTRGRIISWSCRPRLP